VLDLSTKKVLIDMTVKSPRNVSCTQLIRMVELQQMKSNSFKFKLNAHNKHNRKMFPFKKMMCIGAMGTSF